jgi:DNA invertase Pin-like site-specific DNA recombinase
MIKIMRKSVILARVSTKRQEEEGLSLEDIQLPQMREYAEKEGMEVVHEFVFNESAGEGIRKKFDEVIAFVKQRKDVDIIIAFRVDRATRNYADAVLMDDLRLRHRKELHFVHDRLVLTARSDGRDIQDWDTKVFLAKMQLNRLKDDGVNTKYAKLRDGELPWLAPYGHKNEPIDKRSKTVVTVPFKANIVRKLYELYATGTFSYTALSKRIEDDYSVKLPNSAIGTILKNRFYIGEIYDKATNTYYPHDYEQLLPHELYWQVQDIIASHGSKKAKYTGLATYRALMLCKKCGCTITPEYKEKKQKNGNVHSYWYYHCTGKRGKHDGIEWLSETEVTKQLGTWFDGCKVPDDELPRLEQALKEAHGGKAQFNGQQFNYLTTEIKKLQNRIEVAYDDKCDGSITQAEYDNRRAKWRAKQQEYERKLARLSKSDEAFYVTASYLLEIGANGKKLFEAANPAEKRELVGLLGQNLLLNGRTIELNLNKPFDSMAACNNHSEWLRGPDSNRQP